MRFLEKISHFPQGFKFIIVGIVNNVVAYLIFFLLYSLLANPVWSATVSYFASILLSYAMHSAYTFSFKGPTLPALLKYVCLYLLGYLLSISLLLTLIGFSLPALIAQLMVIPVVALLMYFLSRYMVFV